MTTETTLEQLKANLRTAIESGDDNLFQEAFAAMNKAKVEIAKAATEAQKREATALAGEREKLARNLTATISILADGQPEKGQDRTQYNNALSFIKDIRGKLVKIKATGFTFSLPDETALNERVALSIPTVKAHRTGTGGGAGKSKEAFGKPLDALYQEFKGQVGNIKVLNLEADADTIMAIADTNSKQWQVKNAVVKAAIAKGLLKPVA